MAIKGATRSVHSDMSVEEFKEWLNKFDTDGDGRISKAELKKAIKSVRGRFSSWKSRQGFRLADADGDGFIDENEIENLVEFARQNMGLKISVY
ncbi:putative EF-hand domain-containing protein [Dioscorea sansibarensis]